MPNLLATSGDALLGMTGNYNFGDASLFIPEVTTLPAAELNIVGSMYHVKTSGILAIQSGVVGGDYAIFPLGSLPNTAPDLGISPETYDALEVWLNESGIQIDPTTISGVSGWANEAPNGSSAEPLTQPATGTQPQVQSGAFNGRDAVLFEGAEIMVNAAYGATFNGADVAWTMIAAVVPRNVEDGNDHSIFGLQQQSLGTPVILVNERSDSQAWGYFARDDGSVTSIFTGPQTGAGSVVEATPVIVTMIESGAGGGSLSLRVDGVEYMSGSGNNMGQMTIDDFSLGAIRNGGPAQQWFDGHILEFCLYSNSGLTNTEARTVEQFMSHRWDIALA